MPASLAAHTLTLEYNNLDQVREVFAQLGKGGDVATSDLEAMCRAVATLPGRHDFSAFALAGGAHVDPSRELFAAELVRVEAAGGERLELRLEGEGFLRGMVRSIAGTLLEVGAGAREAAAFAGLLAGAPRSAAGPTAPASGLTLERVDYGPRWRPLEEVDTRLR